jgi:myo-inositol-1(or 4)-monophosphatase
MLRSALLNVMIKAAQKAARALKRDFGEVEHLQVSLKGPGNFVSAADHRAEDILYEELNRARPGYSFLGEEGGRRAGTDATHTWIVDPLDGTMNFLHGIPHFAISLALEREGAIVAGVVYNPATDDLFTAEKGKGSFLNDRRLRVAGRSRLADAVVARSSVMKPSRCRSASPACGASVRPRSISHGWRPDASTATGSATCRRGTWRRAWRWYARPAAM